MKRIAALAVAIPLLSAQTAHAPMRTVTAVRHWRLGDVTRVAVEVSGPFQTRSDRLHDPERVYYDILNARPSINGKRAYSEIVPDRLLKKVRVAETVPGITRVVLDLGDVVDATTSELVNPHRLIIELHLTDAPVRITATPALPPPTVAPPAAPAVSPPARPVARIEAPPAVQLATVPTAEAPEASVTPARRPKPLNETPLQPTSETPARKAEAAIAADPSAFPKVEFPRTPAARLEAAKVEPVVPRPAAAPPAAPPSSTPAPTPPPASAPEDPGKPPKPARHTSEGENSLVRTLGLKINRVVIDPGHGGHDEGTMGPKGLLEKDLVLDVAQRLGKLIEQRMGAEVIYTRTDDSFIPLEGRTALANEKQADLFLSIHANSSPAKGVTGIETYYLNLTGTKDALDVAARENASSQKSVFELRDLIQKITLQDKAEESHEFASRIQASLQALSSRSFPGEKNRGVRRAPFVVLIGANMPSVLAEIGFLSNPREEALLRKPDYRQKVAEALYRGVSHYAESLSHFQVAQSSKQ